MKKVFKATRKDQYVQPVEFDPGRYTFHAAVKGEVYSFALKTESGSWLNFDLSWQLEEGEWSRITHTFDLTEKCVDFSLFASETTTEVLIGDPMFEEGNNRSTPSVSPLDLDEVSENISERVTVNFDVLDDRINANVTAITTVTDDVTGLTTRVSEAESEISVQAGIIEQKADKTEVTALGTTVTSLGLIVDAHTGQIAQKVSQTEYDAFGNQVSNQFSQINQRAGEIEISVSSLDEKVDENKGLSEAYADSAAASAESAAKSYAEAKAEAERVIAEAYADGIVDAEEQARIDDVNSKLAAAKAYAEAQDAILKDQQEDYTDQAAAAAQAAAAIDAQNRAEAQALWAKTEAGSYTDGEITTLNNQLLDTGINIQQQLITITSDKTIFRDNQGNPIALFNSSWTKIQASAIELEGYTTINENFKVILDGSIEAVNAKFSGIIQATGGNVGALEILESGAITMYDPDSGDIKLLFSQSSLPLVSDLMSTTVFGGSTNIGAGNTSSSQVLTGSTNVNQGGATAQFGGTTISITGSGRLADSGFASSATATLYARRGYSRVITLASVSITFTGASDEFKDSTVISPPVNLASIQTGNYTFELVVTRTGNTGIATATSTASTFSWGFTQQNVRYQMYGLDGMMFFYSNHHFHFTEGGGMDGRALPDKWNTPGVLLSATVNSGGGWNRVWGAKQSTTQPPAPSPVGRYTIHHTIGHTNYQVSCVSHTENRSFRVYAKNNTNVVVECRTIGSSPALSNAVFDIVLTGNNYPVT